MRLVLKRYRDYRAVIAQACHRHATRTGSLAVVLYDVTSLHFEAEREDKLRRVGMSKEHRAGPQVTVGLLTTAGGFPLEVDLFEGNKAETKTLIPVLTRFRDRHQARDIVVVADAGKVLTGIAAEVRGPGTGRIRLQVLPDASSKSLTAFLAAVATPGLIVHTNGWHGYQGLPKAGYDHRPIKQRWRLPDRQEILPRAHRTISNIKTWLEGTYRGTSAKHLQTYLDE